MDQKYLKIIDLPYKKSSAHKQMPITDRAAQFAAFSALEGYDQKIKDHSQIEAEKKEISTDEIENIDRMLKELIEKQQEYPLIKLDFYDSENGQNKIVVERVKKVDLLMKRLVLVDQSEVDFDDIYSIQWYN
ncbi:MAG: hypothetical protein ACI4WG_06045 [Erysipelotrichaceae bacterium]